MIQGYVLIAIMLVGVSWVKRKGKFHSTDMFRAAMWPVLGPLAVFKMVQRELAKREAAQKNPPKSNLPPPPAPPASGPAPCHECGHQETEDIPAHGESFT